MIQQFYFCVYIQRKWNHYLKEIYLCSHVHSSIVYDSQGMETTQESGDRWMNKENVEYYFYYFIKKIML